ncbi:hypothetical protein, partial [Legionella feeleii]
MTKKSAPHEEFSPKTYNLDKTTDVVKLIYTEDDDSITSHLIAHLTKIINTDDLYHTLFLYKPHETIEEQDTDQIYWELCSNLVYVKNKLGGVS